MLVSNQRVVHYLSKSDGYVPEKAYGLLHEHYKMIDKGMDVKNIIDITDKYFKKCSRVGIEYRKGKEKK